LELSTVAIPAGANKQNDQSHVVGHINIIKLGDKKSKS
jgi:hypothetical protein